MNTYDVYMAHRMIFFGNGVNRIAERNISYSWGVALGKLQKQYVPNSFLMEESDAPSFPLLLQSVLNFNDMSAQRSQNPLKNFKDEVSKLSPTFVHRYLYQLVQEDRFDSSITTNYDFAFEKAFPEQYHIKPDYVEVCGHKVYHIHGTASDDDIVMSMDTYHSRLQQIIKENPQWLQDFCDKEVHMCGFSFHPEEIIVWHALQERLRKLQRKKHFEELTNRCFIYLFYTDRDYKQQQCLANLLRSYATCPILIPVPTVNGNFDYKSAWLQVFARMQMIFCNIRLCDEKSETFGVLKYAFLESRGKNLTVAYVPSHKFPHLCKMAIPDKKRERLSGLTDTWCFYVEIDGNVYLWTALTRDIMTGIPSTPKAAYRNTNSGYDFYLDYTSGVLYSCPQDSTDVTDLYFVCQLTQESNLQIFESKIFPILEQ